MLFKIACLMAYVVIVCSIYFAVNLNNPVYAVLALILGFMGVALLLILLSADYMAILFVLIYAGAISILIMFVVMMLDLKELELKKKTSASFLNYISAILISGSVLYLSTYLPTSTRPRLHYTDWFRIFNTHSNIETVGMVLYSLYNFQFIILGVILYIAMVVVISLVIRRGTFAKRQEVSQQVRATNKQLLRTK